MRDELFRLSAEHHLRIPPALKAPLTEIALLMESAATPWWIIGSAAVEILSGREAHCRDIDVLLDSRDLHMLAARLGREPEQKPASDLFRSEFFLTIETAAMPAEFMSGLSVYSGHDWQLVLPLTRICVPIGSSDIYIPCRDEMSAILARFGRRKDKERLRLLSGTE